jgi:hypothetical protein
MDSFFFNVISNLLTVTDCSDDALVPNNGFYSSLNYFLSNSNMRLRRIFSPADFADFADFSEGKSRTASA